MTHDLPADELARLYREGVRTKELARRFGVSRQTVARRLAAAGVVVQQGVPTPPIEELVVRYEAGEALTDLAGMAGVSPQTIGRRLRAAGVTLRTEPNELAKMRMSESSRRFVVPLDRVRELRAAGYSTADMAAELGIPAETIRERMVAEGIDRLPGKARPERNHFWAGGLTVDGDGYILVKSPDHPNRNHAGYVRQHRLVMEAHLGRYLDPREVVDHVNRDASDNRLENLALYPSNAEHLRATVTGRRNVSPAVREILRQAAVHRARQRVAAILAESGTDAGL